MSNYKGVIFDLDGTLLNTIEDITDALNYALTKQSFNEITVSEAKYMVGSGAKILIERLLNDVIKKGNIINNKEEVYQNLFNDYMYSYNLWKTNHTAPYPGMVRTLNILKKRGIKLAVFSNKPMRDTESIIKKYFPNVFDVVMGQVDNLPVKPDPSGIFEILKLFKLPIEEVLYVGDSDIDVKTFINAKMDGIGVCYGFRSKSELENAGAKITINSPRELIKLFDSEYNGVILFDKPYQMTSQDAVSFIRKNLKVDKVGHAGTLDPLATGLLVVLLGDATKLSSYLLSDDKHYVAQITIGEETDTWDKEGTILSKKDVEEDLDVDGVLSSLIGEISLAPPMHSAIKVNGKKLYEIARSGKSIECAKRDNIIYEIKRITDIKKENKKLIFSFECKVSKGTYIRSICHEIGIRLGYPAYMTELRRTQSGDLNVKDACTIEQLKNNEFEIINILEAINKQFIFPIRESLLPFIQNGRKVRLPIDESLIFITYQDELLAIYEKEEDGFYKAKRVWKKLI